MALYFLSCSFAFKNTANGWGFDSPCSKWDGLVCDSDGHVIGLSLVNKLDGGYLTPFFGMLEYLVDLDISNAYPIIGPYPKPLSRVTTLTFLNMASNAVTGKIPESITLLRNLRLLSIARNQLVGSIPQTLGGLSALTYLDLSYNYLEGSLPSSLGDMRSLRLLDLTRNSVSGPIPASIGNLTSVQVVRLGGSQLSGPIPESISGLQSVYSLDVSSNQLASIPASITALSNLMTLILHVNRLQGSIPEGIGNLVLLTALYARQNQLTGGIPASIGNLSLLQQLDLSYNSLSGSIPESITKLTALTALMLLYNPSLVGPLPSGLGALVNLVYLVFVNNVALGGTIPGSITALTKLQLFGVANCGMSGTVPEGIYSLTSLAGLNLAYNAFEGTIPSGISKLSSLSVLGLRNNRFSGSLPETVSKLTRLVKLRFEDNNFVGPFPAWVTVLTNLDTLMMDAFQGPWSPSSGLTSLSKLTTLILSGLTGEIPPELGSLVSLNYLSLNNNLLTGSIPASLSKLTNLYTLKLISSQLQGTIPAGLGILPSLFYLSLRDNLLTGTVPAELGNLTRLTSLILTQNSLEGDLPSSLGKLGALQYLALPSNSFTGIPNSLSTLSSLSILDLGYLSNLQGEQPSFFGSLTKLTRLRMTYTKTSGSIPNSWSKLVQLQYLNLISCSLNGTIPSGLSALIALTYLDLHSNQISGTIPSWLSSSSRLQHLDLGYNILAGTMPAGVWTLAQLTRLALSSNRLFGTLSADVSKLSRLQTLNLDKNQFSGPLPAAQVAMLALTELDFRLNFFTGVVSDSISTARALRELAGTAAAFAATAAAAATEAPHVPCSLGFDNLAYNCFNDLAQCTAGQRSLQSCRQFCNNTLTSLPCGGRGSCFLDPTTQVAQCACNPGFVQDPLDRGACIATPAAAPPPPPVVQVNLTAGVAFSAIPQLFLNRWSRYLSVASFTSNGVPDWSVMASSTWAAPGPLFLSYDADAASGTNILEWGFVRDQGTCAACWATASADAIAAAQAIVNSSTGGPVPVLSAEQLLACANNSGGCLGDFPTNALDYAVGSGLALALGSDSDPPQCNASAASASPQAPRPLLMYEAVQFRGWFGLLLTLQSQPALVLLQGSSAVFQAPSCQVSNFVLSDPACYGGSLDHTVVVLGYDLTALQPYWLVRNSWGQDWCLGGYLRLAILGGAGACGMNVLPAYYPVPMPAAGDPCYTGSTVPDGAPSRAPALNPCGGGRCQPQPAWGPYSYTCDCSGLGRFIAVNNSVTVSAPDAGLGVTQTCAPVDACSLTLSNPCVVGTCTNDNLGGYSCVCPLGYFENTLTDGRPTCSYGFSSSTTAYYTAQPGVSCATVAATYGLSLAGLLNQNPGLNCSNTTGAVVNVTNPSYSCNISYTAGLKDKTCKDISDRIFAAATANTQGGSSTVTGPSSCAPGTATCEPSTPPTQVEATIPTAEQLQQLNPGLNCSSVPRGQMVCLQAGAWSPPQVCTQSVTLGPAQDCPFVIQRYFATNPLLFYAYNQGIDCDRLTNPGSSLSLIGANGATVCTGTAPVGVVDCTKAAVPPKYPKGSLKQYTLKRSDTCTTIAGRLKFSSAAEVQAVNNRITGFTCPGVVGAIICCPV